MGATIFPCWKIQVGVGVALGVKVGLGVSVAVNVAVGVAVNVGVGVRVGVGVGVRTRAMTLLTLLPLQPPETSMRRRPNSAGAVLRMSFKIACLREISSYGGLTAFDPI